MKSTAQRARSAEAKANRREAFKRAALDIAARDGVRKVSLSAVTAEVGLHASALRRYFDSTEELLLDLAEDGWRQWQHEFFDCLDALPESPTPVDVARAVVGSLVRLPVFCDLLTHVGLSLEGAVRLERARAYKTSSTAAYQAMSEALAATLDVPDQDARTVITTAMTGAAYLYQISRPTPTLQQLYAEEPGWAHSALRFNEQLTELVLASIRGVVARGGHRTRDS